MYFNLISNLVFQINFQVVFHCDCATNSTRNVENYKQNACFYLMFPLRLTFPLRYGIK